MNIKKYEFTPEGVAEKMYDLYNASAIEIELEATYVEDEFHDWMNYNFELTEDQLVYMISLGLEFAVQNGGLLAYCFRNRLQVTLSKGAISQRSSKFIRREESVEVTSQPGQEDIVSGGVEYFIS